MTLDLFQRDRDEFTTQLQNGMDMAVAWGAYSNCCSIRALTISITGNSLSLSIKNCNSNNKNKKHLPLIHDRLRNFDLFCKCGIKQSTLYKPSSDIDTQRDIFSSLFFTGIVRRRKERKYGTIFSPSIDRRRTYDLLVTTSNALPLS